ncbi:MAG: VOC family protein [Chloroflexi bacterium]|nr:VOC family protein [Chloroflexota bacterium]
MATNGTLNIATVNQIGIVVRDVNRAVERYWKDFGIGPWLIFTFGPGVKEMTYYGQPCSFAFTIAMAQVGPLFIELLQPLSGPTPHQDFLDKHGEGLQHLGVFVEKLAPAAAEMERLGYKAIASAIGIGPAGDGGAAYFDTLGSLGTLLELIEMPRNMPPPERIYPAPGG